MHAVTQFFPNRSVNEKNFAFFGPYAPDIAKQAESDAWAGVLSHTPLDAA
jgi:hypothetical protein